MNIGADILPKLPKDVTDRNRTSPFAFTGNKFEFRALGSNMNPADSNTFLNTIVADVIADICDELEKFDEANFDDGLQTILQKIIKDHKKVVFNGDNYADAWVVEAEKRGLPNLRTTPEALEYLLAEKNVEVFTRHDVLTKGELESRFEVLKEQYETKIDIEGNMAIEIIRTQIIPATLECQGRIADNLMTLQELNIKAGTKSSVAKLEKIGEIIDNLTDKTIEIEVALENNDQKAILSTMLDARKFVDTLEGFVDDDLWPLAKYRELLFVM
jgi:glutamine synthetase